MITVLSAAAGESWETEAVRRIQSSPDLHLGRRCVDVPDLLSTAASAGAHVALLSLDLPGLDADTVYRLGQHRVRTVAVAPPSSLRHARALGIQSTLGRDAIGELDQFLAGLTVPVAVEPAPAPATGEGAVLAVWGPQGAPGRSTLALSLAAELAASGKRTLVIDADPYGGTLAQMLGVLDEVSGLLAAARAANVGQLERVAAHVYEIGSDLSLLSGLPRAALWSQVRGGAVEQIVERSRAEFDRTIIDCGFSLEAADQLDAVAPQRNFLTLQSLACADRVVAVGVADPVGLTRLARGIHELRDTVADAAITVAVNRHRTDLGWTADQIAETLHRLSGIAPSVFIPSDQRTVDRALMRGRTLRETAADAPVSRAVRKLASRLEAELPSQSQLAT